MIHCESKHAAIFDGIRFDIELCLTDEFCFKIARKLDTTGRLKISYIIYFSFNCSCRHTLHAIKCKGKVFPLKARLWPRGWVEV